MTVVGIMVSVDYANDGLLVGILLTIFFVENIMNQKHERTIFTTLFNFTFIIVHSFEYHLLEQLLSSKNRMSIL